MKDRLGEIRLKELLRFLVGGGSAVVTDYLVYRVLLYWNCDLSPSKAVSYICGAAVGFVINKLWTFESKGFSKMEIIRYIVLYAFSACVNAGVNRLVLIIMGMQFLAFLCATGISTVLNFVGQKFFVFVGKKG